jgi:hypothetical protein
LNDHGPINGQGGILTVTAVVPTSDDTKEDLMPNLSPVLPAIICLVIGIVLVLSGLYVSSLKENPRYKQALMYSASTIEIISTLLFLGGIAVIIVSIVAWIKFN